MLDYRSEANRLGVKMRRKLRHQQAFKKVKHDKLVQKAKHQAHTKRGVEMGKERQDNDDELA
jgi:hypothetical protein